MDGRGTTHSASDSLFRQNGSSAGPRRFDALILSNGCVFTQPRSNRTGRFLIGAIAESSKRAGSHHHAVPAPPLNVSSFRPRKPCGITKGAKSAIFGPWACFLRGHQSNTEAGRMPKPSHEPDVFDRREMPCDHNSLLPDRKRQAIVTGKLDQKASSPQHRSCSFNWHDHGNLPHLRAGECPSRSSRKARIPWWLPERLR